MRRFSISLLLAVLVGVLLAPVAGAATRQTFTGTLDGAEYKVVVPEGWNGTLLLYSHGYYPMAYPPPSVALANRADTEEWLLDHGYALAASNFQRGGTGYLVEEGVSDGLRLLDWFEDTVGEPRRTISYGMSLGASIATLLAERHPDRFDGVAAICGTFDPAGVFNVSLDINFAVKTLLTDNSDDIDLVLPDDPAASTAALLAGVQAAVETPRGRARLALIASFNNLVGWYDAHAPRPVTEEDRIRAQARWIHDAYVATLGSSGRPNVEAQAGGNPSSNVGVDYRRQLHRSDQTAEVRAAYRAAGLDLRADLRKLAAAPRIAADPGAAAYFRHGVPHGTTPTPMVTLHTTGDGGGVPDGERLLADRVRANGDPSDLRQLFVERGAHCSNNAAEEITMLTTLVRRIETGRWPRTSPRRLTAAANALGPDLHNVLDIVTGVDAPEPPAFVRFHPTTFQRPTPLTEHPAER